MDYKEFLHFLFDDLTGYVEFREIDEQDSKQKFVPINKIDEYKPPKDKHVYYGTFVRKNKFNGTKSGVGVTNVLWLDFDNKFEMNVSEFNKYVNSCIKRAELPKPSVKVFSGHGFHCYWKLTKPCNDAKPIIKEMANKTKSDTAVADNARVMRLPDTFNIKHKKGTLCKVVENNVDLVYDKSKFESLLKLNESPLYVTEKPCLNIAMKGVDIGNRNFWLRRLIDDLQSKDKTYEESNEICFQWNKRNKPSMDVSEFRSQFSYFWNGLKVGNIHVTCNPIDESALEKLNPFCIWDECSLKSVGKNFRRENPILKMSNKMISDLRKWSGKELLLMSYLRIIYQRYGVEEFKSLEQLENETGMTRKTITKMFDKYYIKHYVKTKKVGRKTLYGMNHSNDFSLGYSIINRKAVYDGLGKVISPNAYKLYVLLCQIGGAESMTYISYMRISKESGIGTQHLTALTKELEDNYYIIKDIRTNGVKTWTEYSII